ncbi:phage tail assembly chaperone [Pseudomonas putida]|uniref:tail fiber assembly protein n=1 Tax=Pseudomonas putida TaxID=303 RepID=UPI0027BDD199|nr:tail fiber assembly protein [Pseudomonas putida]MDQ2488455.1 phage tail assembly chaperone [Pseudomonas putida]
MLTVVSARNPQWNDAGHRSLNLLVTFEENPQALREVPFTASPDDCEAYGRELFARAVALEFGEVLEPSDGELVRGVLQVRAQLNTAATVTINALQVALAPLQDAVRLGMATEAEASALPVKQAEYDAWCAYRVLLSRIEEQAGYPASVTWPPLPGADDVSGTDPTPE